jgi:serine phosphatase RsbU (regulator of sigma subunit)
MQGPLTDRAVLERLRRDLGAGRRFVGETVNYRADGSPFIINWSIDPVTDADGVVTHYVAAQEDVTERVRSAKLLAAQKDLDDALTRIVNSSTDQRDGLQELAEEIVAGATGLTDAGVVAVIVQDEHRAADVTAGQRRAEGVGAAFPFSRPGSVARGVVEVTGLDPDEAAFLDRTGFEQFAGRAGAVVAALAEYQRQRSTALRLQHDLLPKSDLAAPGFTVVPRYLPGTSGLSVGGDWYDVAVTDERVVFSVGDVSGSGIEAAALMGRLRVLADVELRRGIPVSSLIELLDDVCASDDQFVTALFVEFDRRAGDAEIWSAGHLPAIGFGSEGARLLEPAVAPPLGHIRGACVGSVPVQLEVGTGLVLFTDGLIEEAGQLLDDGLERVAALASRVGEPDRLADLLLTDRPTAHVDDVAVLVLRRDT